MIDLSKITKETLKNLCFGCKECEYLLDVYVHKDKFFKIVWLAYDSYGVFLDSTHRNVHKYGCTKSEFKSCINDYRKMGSYEELLEHFGNEKGWLLC
jgi:transposase